MAGVFGFFYGSSRPSGLPPVPEGTSLGDYVRYDAGKLELGRYVSLMAAFIGGLLSLFPKGR